MDTLRQDLKFALRMLARNPGFTTVAVLTLALGIGAISAVFSMVNSVLLRPLSYPESRELVKFGDYGAPLLLPRLAEWKDGVEAFERIAWYAGERGSLTGGEQPRRIRLAKVSIEFFRVFDLVPLRGRLLEPEDQRPAAPPAAVLSEGFWKSEFGADPGQLGRTVTVDGSIFTVSGSCTAGRCLVRWTYGFPAEQEKIVNRKTTDFPGSP